ncbi:MAG: ATPase/protein kinase family protein [Labilithrix sp.]|nr:ATPase/protein kinase family protein [Labilithrix sp.]
MEGFRGTKRFEIKGRLGTGGMGVVYRARDVERGETVALKTMAHLDPDALLRFKREFRSLADISHPNVVQLYELFSEGEHWFFTMELVDGVDLLTWVQSSLTQPPPAPLLGPEVGVSLHPTIAAGPSYFNSLKPPPPLDSLPDFDPPLSLPLAGGEVGVRDEARLRAAFRQLGLGLMAIHTAGKLHRDVKPPNVLVASDGRVVLLDFGVAADFADRGTHGIDDSLSGTPAYMAPEQASFTRATPATDWYAVGVVLYEALTGRLPFDGSPPSILFAKQQGQPLPPSAYVEGVSEDLAKLAMDLMVPDPRKRPTGEQVLARLEGGRPSIITSPSEASFVGRRPQLEQLRSAFEASAHGLVIVMLHGRSGMGKSALASRFLTELAAKQDALVLAGRCYERETVPFKAIDPVVDELRHWLSRLPENDVATLLPGDLDALARLFPVLGDLQRGGKVVDAELDRAPPHELRRRAFAALRELLTNIAREYRFVLHIDDLQWCDGDSVQLLEALFAPPSLSWMVTLSYRSELSASSAALGELRASIARLGDGCTFREVDVGELAPAEAGELARTLVDSKDPGVVALVTAEAGGNPLFLAELARYANERFGDERDVSGISLEQVILDRVSRLPPDARDLLETLSVAGGPLSQRVAARATALGSNLWVPALALRGARLVVTRGLADDDDIETAHDRVRETVAHSLGDVRRKARHVSIARALAAELPTFDADAVFSHYVAADDDESARGVVLAAAEAAAHSLAFLRAAALYREAIRLRAGPLDVLHRALGDALANAERLGDAADAYLAGAAHASAGDSLELRRLAAEDYLKSGRDARGLAVLRTVLEEVDLAYPKSNERALTSLLWHETKLRVAPLRQRLRGPRSMRSPDLARIDVAFSAATGLSLSDPLRGADYAARGLLLALEAGEPVRLCRALALAAGNSAVRGEPGRGRAEDLVRAAERIAREIEEPRPRALALLAAGTVHFFLGEWRSARSDLERADRVLRESCRAVSWELSNTQSWTCNVLILSGQLREAARRLPAFMADARGREDLFAMSHLVYPTSISHIIDDDVSSAAEVAGSFGSYDVSGWSAGHWGGFIGVCSVDRYRGDGPGAWRRVGASLPTLEKSMMWRSAMVRVFTTYEVGLSALAAASAGVDRREALRSCDRWAKELAKENLRYAPALGDLLRAGAAAVRGDKGDALEALDAAIPRLELADLGYLAACARHRKGELTGGAYGRELVEQSETYFRREGIKHGEKCLAMSAPGF